MEDAPEFSQEIDQENQCFIINGEEFAYDYWGALKSKVTGRGPRKVGVTLVNNVEKIATDNGKLIPLILNNYEKEA